MDSWLNTHYSKLYEKWGVPEKIISFVNESKDSCQILEYVYRWSYTSDGKVTKDYFTGEIKYKSPQTENFIRKYNFFVNHKGIIYKWLLN